MFACLELSFKIIYKTASCCMFLFLLKNLYPYPRIGVFLEIAYPCIRYVSYPIHVPVSVHPSLEQVILVFPKLPPKYIQCYFRYFCHELQHRKYTQVIRATECTMPT